MTTTKAPRSKAAAAESAAAERTARKARIAARERATVGCTGTWQTCPCYSCEWWRDGDAAERGIAPAGPTRVEVDNSDRVETTGPRDPDAPTLTPDARYALVCAWLVDLGRPVEIRDVGRRETEAARRYVRDYTGTFPFVVKMRDEVRRLSVGQAKGVLNCLRRELLNPAPAASVPVVPVAVASVTDPLVADLLGDLLGGGA